MTNVTPTVRPGTAILQGYKNGIFIVNGMRYDHPIVITADGVRAWDGESFDDLPAYDVLLLGTGDTQIWPSAELRVRIPMEVMTTAAACRTYNALISDGRAVAALLKPVARHPAP